LSAAPPAAKDNDLEPAPPKDDDPDGMKLLGSADPLELAAKLLQPLTTLAPNNIDIWIAIYDVAIRRSKHFVMNFVDLWALTGRLFFRREITAGSSGLKSRGCS